MKAIKNVVITAVLMLSCSLSYADLEGNVGRTLIWPVDLDGNGVKNYIAIDVVDPSVTECGVPYVGYGIVLISLEVTGSTLLKNQAIYSAALTAQATGFPAKAMYHMENSSTYNMDFCHLDAFIVFTP